MGFRRRMVFAGTGFAVAFGILAAGCGAATADEVGTAAAVKPAATGTAPGSAARRLAGGSGVVFKDKIDTDAGGALQVLFADRSLLGVGPNTDVTIDEFVYDPNAGTGAFVTSVTKGTFRFISGEVARRHGTTIKLPGATIGIRG